MKGVKALALITSRIKVSCLNSPTLAWRLKMKLSTQATMNTETFYHSSNPIISLKIGSFSLEAVQGNDPLRALFGEKDYSISTQSFNIQAKGFFDHYIELDASILDATIFSIQSDSATSLNLQKNMIYFNHSDNNSSFSIFENKIYQEGYLETHFETGSIYHSPDDNCIILNDGSIIWFDLKGQTISIHSSLNKENEEILDSNECTETLGICGQSSTNTEETLSFL